MQQKSSDVIPTRSHVLSVFMSEESTLFVSSAVCWTVSAQRDCFGAAAEKTLIAKWIK